ncbi:MAG TPA: DEAD/DEAH box helicase [Kofleriaceae bacterium]|jgi:replicative superfamily II helicase
MAVRGAFIGIDKYLRPMTALLGARRDAMALHALFADTYADLDATRLLDRDATGADVRAELQRVLVEAGPDDLAIVVFAGHGTRDHQLVLYDSNLIDDATMIAMTDFAAMFRASPAKHVLCVLDCCFSGEASALDSPRVLEQSSAARNLAPSWPELFEGRGRVLIAAASATESAWEDRDSKHGLLTKALIATLTDPDQARGVGAVMDRVLALVRTDAARMGRVQTPERVDRVEGGWDLPTLVRGKAYRDAFPDTSGVMTSGAIADLTAFAIPLEAIAAWSARFPKGLNELQRLAVNRHRVLDEGRHNLLVVAPTGAGKTFVGELAALRHIGAGRRAVFLLPYRALVNEKYEELAALYGEQLRLEVIRCTGDHQDETLEFTRGKYDIAVLTYEMFLNLILGQRRAASYIGVVVLDEAQFVTDPSRGIVVELLLTLLRRRDAELQIVALSAVIGDANDLHGWLDAELLRTLHRPIPLVEGVLDRTGTFQYRDPTDDVDKRMQLVPLREIQQRGDKPSAQDVIVPLTRQLVGDDETVIVFRNSRGAAQGSANYLAEELGLPPATAALGALDRHDLSSSSSALRRCLQRGVAFHTANLTRDERVAVERAFRANDELRVLTATTTLAAGVNTPASTVILAEQEFLGEDGRRFTVAEYKNMAGRAGRPGFDRPGRSVIYAKTSIERDQLFRRYVRGKPEDVRSSFRVDELDTWILRLLSQIDEVAKDEVVTLLANTYGGYTASLADLGWQANTRRALQKLLDEMLANDLLEEERGNVRLTLLGRTCGQSSLSFGSCLRLVEILRRQGTAVTAPSLLLLVQALAECDRAYTPTAKREPAWPPQLSHRAGAAVVRDMQRGARDEQTYAKRCKRGLVLLDWIAGLPMTELETRYAIDYGDIVGFANTTRFHLRAAADIAELRLVTPVPEIEAVLRALEVGVPAAIHDLLELRVEWARGELLALQAAGVATREALWGLPEAGLASLVGPARFAQLQRLRP